MYKRQTGGGKTEAYLALTAFTILWRRTQAPADAGVSVIMRYTLRLLTSQQFERSGRLIAALEFLRYHQNDLDVELGEAPIRLGMWVGKATTPNKLDEAEKCIDAMKSSPSVEKALEKNKFQVSACPWCGCRLASQKEGSKVLLGYHASEKEGFYVECRNPKCLFHSKIKIPFDVVDASLYRQPPTLLFATVDKFAQLVHVPEGHVVFGSIIKSNRPPDLIIQDELHLLNGPLGSMVALFELLVEQLCTRNGHAPKIIASTATTRNTDAQVAGLYGGRNVNIFPAPGLRQHDSYFAFTDKNQASKRRYVGFMATGKTQLDTHVKALLPNLLFTRALLYRDLQAKNEAAKLNDYWTVVAYCNTLRLVGKIYNKVGDEIYTCLLYTSPSPRD